MKKFTLLAIAALTAAAANAQSSAEAASNLPIIAEKPADVAYIILSDGAQAAFENAGSKMLYLGPDDLGRNLYIWSEGETLSGYDASYPCVDEEEGTYASFSVANNDWFGAGYNIGDSAPEDLSMLNEDTRFHLAYMTPTNSGPASMYLTILNNGDNQAQVSLGEAYESHPVVGSAPTDDWLGFDLSLGDLAKLDPRLNLAGQNLSEWTGNIFAFGGGAGNLGKTFSFDACYFYNLGDGSNEGDNNPGEGEGTPGDDENNGVEGIAAESLSFVVTGNTVNLNGGNGIELYDLSGKLVKKTAGCVLGINNLSKGVYVAKAGKLVQKVVVR